MILKICTEIFFLSTEQIFVEEYDIKSYVE